MEDWFECQISPLVKYPKVDTEVAKPDLNANYISFKNNWIDFF